MEKSLTIKPARSYFETRKRLCFHFENKFVAIGIYEKQILDYILWLTLKSNIEHQTSELGVRNTINYKNVALILILIIIVQYYYMLMIF